MIGATGSGKTVAGIYHLSRMNLRARPWVVFDMKDDEHLNGIERAQHVELDWTPTEKSKGVFVVHPRRKDEEAVDSLLDRIYEHSNIGIFIDEPDLANSSAAFEDILRKGRSRLIPAITLSQRPVDVTRYVFSEATFIRVYFLNDERDWATVEAFTPLPSPEDFPTLNPYFSFYYQVGKQDVWLLSPAPPVEQSLARIDEQLTPEERKKIFI